MSSDHSDTGYTPLPQSTSNTDTEDEEEERLTQFNDIIYKIDNIAIAELHSNHENGVFYPLDETCNLENNARNRQNTIKYSEDDIPIMVIDEREKDDFWKRDDMSPMRRFCLFISILSCIITVIIFLYVLPCDNLSICSSVVEPDSSMSWDKTLQDVEIYGPVTVLPESPYNLIFLLHGERYRTNDTRDRIAHQRQIPSEGGGVISMQGNNGLPLWLVPLKRLPTIIDCISIDIDQSGKPDCIVVGEEGLLISIEPIAGTIHWSCTTRTISKLPIIIPDINGDNIEDLLTIAMDNTNVSSFVFLSGKTGQLLKHYSINNCISVDIYNLISNDNVSYNCYDDSGKYITRFTSLKRLLNNVKITELYKKFSVELATLPRLFEVVKSYDNECSWKPTPYHHLTIENKGICPGQFCRMNINLTLRILTNKSITIWNHSGLNTLTSKPLFLPISNKPYTLAFAIKFWQWKVLPSEYIKKAIIMERTILERVVVVFVNYTDVQAINISQCDIIQLCHEFNCQPNLNSRKEFTSIDVKYTDNSKFPELINYWSSYDIDATKTLISKVQVIEMDSIISNFMYGNA